VCCTIANLTTFRIIYAQVYAPPHKAVTEFEMERTIVNAGESYAPKASSFGSVILVLDGEAVATTADGKAVSLKRGALFFQSAGTNMTIAGPAEGAALVYFRATKKGAIA
jgi:glyoxylate utilization-related uncharacterized protein